ncbi:MAG: YciI family protein [Parvularculaceae bacterium]
MTPPRPKNVPRLPEAAYAFWCADGPSAATVRVAALAGHLAHIERHHDRYLIAGPMRRDPSPEICGSFFIVTAESETAARDLIAGDPYVSQGAFASIDCCKLTPAAGRWMGGVIWESADELMSYARG